MPDRSELDNRYFVDEHVYNCPFCNRRNVAYSVTANMSFDWTETKHCYVHRVTCHSCGNNSLHLTFENLNLLNLDAWRGKNNWRFKFPTEVDAGERLDQAFFYSVPTSFFVLDRRVPKKLRELLTEAEGCLKSNFLTGASACARKIVYELAVLKKASGDNYKDRIGSLKETHPEIEPTFFDTLLTIHKVTSSKVHENAYDGWASDHLRIILSSLSEVLHELYVAPAVREDRRKSILAMQKEVLGEPAVTPEKTEEQSEK